MFLKQEERQAIADVAHKAHVRFDGFWLDAPRDMLAQRIGARRGDPSDATVAVLDMQIAQAPPVRDWRAIDAAGTPEDCVKAARAMLT